MTTPAIRIDDRAGAAMGGFDPFAARDLDDHRIRHRFSSLAGAGTNAIAKERRARQSQTAADRLLPIAGRPALTARGRPVHFRDSHDARNERMRVRDVMTYGVIGVPESASLAEAVETMLRSRVSALFVFDAHNALIGVLSEGDLLRRSELGSERKRPHWLELPARQRTARRGLRA